MVLFDKPEPSKWIRLREFRNSGILTHYRFIQEREAEILIRSGPYSTFQVVLSGNVLVEIDGTDYSLERLRKIVRETV